jgi:hypothetical protein
VTVAADGVRDNSGLTEVIPGVPVSAFGTGLSLDLIDNDDGALDAPPPLPNLFIGRPPIAGC